MTTERPREAFVVGALIEREVHFPIWTETEYYLNGIRLSQHPFSVGDWEQEEGGVVEVFHLGAEDAWRFGEKTGLVAYAEADLPRAPKRPHHFL